MIRYLNQILYRKIRNISVFKMYMLLSIFTVISLRKADLISHISKVRT